MEINLNEATIKQAISTLSSSTKALTSTLSEVKGKNELECIERINKINAAYSSLLTQYQALLLKNITITEKTVEAFIEKDQNLATTLFK